MEIKCFLLEPAGMTRYWLRRYKGSDNECRDPDGPGYHQALVFLGDFHKNHSIPTPPRTEPAWPTACACGYVFVESDEWQLFDAHLFRRSDTGDLITIREAPTGAMWFEDFDYLKVKDSNPVRYHGPWDNQSTPSLVVKTPGGEWNVDSRCSNCTRPEDKTHRCWVRHGDAPNITVDKAGDTCAAGPGSIISGNWHGFLRNGFLIQC